MASNITDLYQHYLGVAGEPQAAATLVLAHVTSQVQVENFSVRQAADRLGVSIEKIYALCRSGELRHSKIGRTIRIQAHDLQDYCDAVDRRPAPVSFPMLGI